jgi:hypothetical protein
MPNSSAAAAPTNNNNKIQQKIAELESRKNIHLKGLE